MRKHSKDPYQIFIFLLEVHLTHASKHFQHFNEYGPMINQQVSCKNFQGSGLNQLTNLAGYILTIIFYLPNALKH